MTDARDADGHSPAGEASLVTDLSDRWPCAAVAVRVGEAVRPRGRACQADTEGGGSV